MAKELSTKKRIVITAIRMYNEHGVQNVTSRHIAAKMGIAYGNLNYHYKNKEALLLAIYKKMRNEMSEYYLLREKHSTPFEYLYHLLNALEQFQYEYRFFNLDVLEITRSYPDIGQIISSTLRIRKRQMSNLFKRVVEEEYLLDRDDNTYERLQHKIRIIITFWLSQQVVLNSYASTKIGDMAQNVWDLLVPFMTERGLAEYQRLING